MVELELSRLRSVQELRQQLKAVCYMTGLQNKSIVLFVPDGLPDAYMMDIISLMSEGWAFEQPSKLAPANFYEGVESPRQNLE